MPKGSDTWDVQSNCHVYFPANGDAKINCTRLSGRVCAGGGRTFLLCMWFHPHPRAHRASQCLKGLRAVPLCVSMGWTCHHHGHLHPPLHAACLPASCLHVPSAHSRAALAPPASKEAAGGFVLSYQSRTGPSVGSSAEPHPAGGLCSLLAAERLVPNQQLPLLHNK